MSTKLNKVLIVTIIVIVFFMSAGYSVLNRELSITGDLIYRAEADMRITNVRLDSVSNTIETFSPNFSKDEIILGLNMESDTSTITYKVEVTNYSDVEMGILKIDGLPSNYEVKDYTLKTKLVDTLGNSKSGMIKEFSIVLKADASFKGIQNVRLKLDFEPIYTITYSGFNDDSSYIKEIIKTENYFQTLDNSVDDILVTMNNISTSNYTFNNKKLEIQNVDGNILIENNTPNAPVLNGDMIPVYYDQEQAVWRKADINNENNNWYDYKTQKWANAVTVVEESVKDLSGNNQNGAVHGAKIENGEAYFDGVDDFVEAGYANYDFKDSVSMKVRFKVNQFTNSTQNILGNQEGAGTDLQILSSRKLIFQIHDGTQYQNFTPNYTFELDKWYEVTGTFYQNKMTIYIKDDKGLNTFTQNLDNNINIKISPMTFALGINLDTGGVEQPANITISNASVYDREISATEVENNNTKKDKILFEYDFSQVMNRSDYVISEKDTIIPISDINTMWVWIPRYSYTIKKESGSSDYYGKDSFGNTTPTRLLPGEIDVKFINNSINEKGIAQYTGDEVTNWRTNDAFNFDNVNRNGMWIGKFETTGRLEKNGDACIDGNCNVSNVTIKPNEPSLRNQIISSFFFTSRSMQLHDSITFGFDKNSGDLHMMKNDEWGAVAYLSQSKYGKYGNKDYSGANKEVYQNKSTSYITGSSNGTPSQSVTTSSQYAYNDIINLGSGKGQAGPGASTTGTIYGIYDMSGGSWEYVMGILEYDEQGNNSHNGQLETEASGFKGLNSSGSSTGSVDLPNEKYYNTYKSANPTLSTWTSAKPESACDGGVCYGHGLSETYGATTGIRGWYDDGSYFVFRSSSWFHRGGNYSDNQGGVFYSYGGSGSSSSCSFRLVLV